MTQFAVIAQNDESSWDDVKGDLYHFPDTYQKILEPGCKIIYYKGKMTNKAFASKRLSAGPHYFGVGVIGDSIVDPDSERAIYFAKSSNTRSSGRLYPTR
jgi:predicted HNH restriction endonuclease